MMTCPISLDTMENTSEYKLSSSLIGHSEDVRAVAVFDDGTIISASRDRTASVWRPNRDTNEYVQSAVLKGHTNFVSSVCVLNPTEDNSKSLIITGSNDHHICIFVLGEQEPMRKIQAHKDTVCNLRTGVEAGTFLSSSWDLSAKLWSLDNLDEPLVILHGHTLAVWCVADLPNKSIVTGSADKSVIVWTRTGSKLHKLDGHTDCVRDIAAIKHDEFLTCANDASVRHWDAMSGLCLGVYYGHENYIYSIRATLSGDMVVTSGEDRTIRIWKNGQVDQTITLPAPSIWCVDILNNRDIVAGSSDGIVRIFSADSERWANPEILQTYEQHVQDSVADQQKNLENDMKIDELPTATELHIPGTRDGQTKVINENGKAIAYSWSQSDEQWVKIGDVVGSNGNASKTLYNGKEYDFVFSVDVQDGIPPLKLPYNKAEDPWHAAQKFIHENELSQMFLDQVANFIIKNSGATQSFATDSQFADPFTGGSRYIPGTALPNATTHAHQVTAPISNADPFTGSNRYIPGSNYLNSPAASETLSSPSSVNLPSYIPHTNYLKLEQANYSAIFEKLKELNGKQDDKKVTEEQLEAVLSLAKGQITDPDLQIISSFWTLLSWPSEHIFPVLDVARLAVLHKVANNALCSDNLVSIIQRHMTSDTTPANQMLTFRLLANMFNHESGEFFGLTHVDHVIQALQHLPLPGSKNNQVAISTYILNLVVALMKQDDNCTRLKVFNVLIGILPNFNEPEAVFRCLVALGTLLTAARQNDDRIELIEMLRPLKNIIQLLKTMSESVTMHDPHGRVSRCAKQILDLIN